MSSAAVILHGAGSDSDFISRAFPPARLGVETVVAPDDRTGSIEAMAEQITRECGALRKAGKRIDVVGGVSIGGHAAALWAHLLEDPEPWLGTRLLLALPAWLGAPGDVAAMTAATSTLIRESGIPAALAQISQNVDDPQDWVLGELASSWPTYSDEQLADSLARVASTHTPARVELATICLSSVVVGVQGDPLHPLEVAQQTAAALPRSVLHVVDRADVGRDRALMCPNLGPKQGPKLGPKLGQSTGPNSSLSGSR